MKRPLYFFLFLLLSLLILEGILIWKTDQDDKEAYFNLITSSDPQKNSQSELPKGAARQMRVESQKQLWNLSKTPPQKVKVESNASELFFNYDGQAIQVEEFMKGVICFFQQELFFVAPDHQEYLLQKNQRFLKRNGRDERVEDWWAGPVEALEPKQRVRFLKMDEAIFNYQKSALTADKVKVIDYIANGHSLYGDLEKVETLMEGFADETTVVLSGETPTFEATRLKATFFSQRGLR